MRITILRSLIHSLKRKTRVHTIVGKDVYVIVGKDIVSVNVASEETILLAMDSL
jgi:hypothetical protein